MYDHAEQLDPKSPSSNPRTALGNLSEAVSQTSKEVLQGILNAKEQLAKTDLGRFFEKGLQILISLGILGGEEKENNKKASEEGKLPSPAKTNFNPSPTPVPTPSAQERKTIAQTPSVEKQGEFPKNTPINRTIKEIKQTGIRPVLGILEDHTHNVKLLSLLPGKEWEINKFLNHYEKYKQRYERVSRATHIPPILIATLHHKESGGKFTTYLHNGDPLGKPTTHFPPDILFYENQWEEAAIHALGGNIKDANGKEASNYLQEMRKALRINAQTKDVSKMMAFGEMWNGLGFRKKGILSTYIYAGTNLMQAGRFVSDGVFDETKVSKNVGAAGLILAYQAKEEGRPLKVAPAMS